MNVLRTVQRTIRRYGLIEPGETIVVGVSGGPDSLCLLHILRQLTLALDADLHVAHLNHGLRGMDADADADFVQNLAARWRLPCTAAKADVATMAQQPGLSLEEAARNARYNFLALLACDLESRCIAVGHNADDQTETVLMHWLRGGGLAGLRGMMPVSNLNQLRLIRPLLHVPRAQILHYCQEQGLQPRFDRSNEDTTFYRNRLRHQLLPLLEDYNPQIRRILRHTATVVADDHQLLRSLLLDVWPTVVREETGSRIVFDLPAYRQQPPSLQRSLLREAISRLRHGLRDVSFVQIERALWTLRESHAGTRVTLVTGLEAVLGYNRFAIGDEGLALPPREAPQLAVPHRSLPLSGALRLQDSPWEIQTRQLEVADLPPSWNTNPDPWQAWLDADVLGPVPFLRVRQAGDRFQPLGMKGHHKLLGEFFTNNKVPAAVRDRWPLLSTSDSHIAWVCGLRVDERARVTSATRQAIHIRFVRTHESRT
jgi:tRNA(Ile)-lysidine synthase